MQILKHLIRYILMICIIILCIIIFNFSAENGQQSSGTSGKFAKIIITMSSKNRNLTQEELKIKIENLQPFVRKTAHFSIYMLLGALLYGCTLTFKGKNIIKFDISVILSFIYSCTDELHQKFIPERSGELNDVFLDTTGAFMGILIILIIFIIVVKIHNYKKNKLIESEQQINHNKKKRVLFIASTGGHLNELMQVKPIFNNYDYHIVTEKTKVDDSLKDEYGEKISFLIYGTKKHLFKYIFKFLANCFISLYYFFKYKPEVIVTTGTHTAVPMCYIGKAFGSKIIFIETFANRTTKTVSGKLVYPIADTFVVQWEEMQKLYPKSVCWGWLY